MVDTSLVELGKQRLYPNYRQAPLALVRGQGCEVWDDSGRRYLDFYAGVAVSILGHAHPRLVAAIAEQAGRIIHVANYFYNEPSVRLADRLVAHTGMARVLFQNSGAEANEAMLKLARRHFYARGQTDRYRIVAFDHGFHGRTMGALATTGTPKYREGFGPLTGVTHVPWGDARAVRDVMGDDVAGILFEPMQGEAGAVLPPDGFIQELRRIADDWGCLLLADEVQTGVGRTGKFLGCDHYGVKPDALSLAKSLGGGVPIGAMLASERVLDALPPGTHGTTYGGNPLVCAAALAVLDVLEEERLVEHAADFGQRLSVGLNRLVER